MIAEVNEHYEGQYSDVMTLQMLVAQLPKINAQVQCSKYGSSDLAVHLAFLLAAKPRRSMGHSDMIGGIK